MLYPQNGDRIDATDSVTSLHPMYALPFPPPGRRLKAVCRRR